MRLRWWQYVVGFAVAVLCLAAIVACFAALAFGARAIGTWLNDAAIADQFVRAVVYFGLAIAALIAVAALVGMGIDIAESWLWPAPKGTRERP